MESGRPQLSQVVVAGGRRPDSRLDDLAGLASAIQQQRRDLHGSRDEISRASALLAALWLDPGVAQAAQDAGLSAAAWAATINAPATPPTTLPEPDSGLSAGIQAALEEWLSVNPHADEVGIPQVALAIATAAAGPEGGLMARRLLGLGIRPERLVGALGREIGGDQPDWQEFSASVRNLRSVLGDTAEVTALDIARALQADHPGYGRGTFELLDLGRPAPTVAEPTSQPASQPTSAPSEAPSEAPLTGPPSQSPWTAPHAPPPPSSGAPS